MQPYQKATVSLVVENLEQSYDFIVIGGGSNGLSAASYLSKHGFSTLILEKEKILGGCAITKDITLPGFHHDVFASSINIWKLGPVEEELGLKNYGYAYIDPQVVASTPFRNGKAITIYRDIESTVKSIEQFSRKDASAFRKVHEYYQGIQEIIEAGFSSPPSDYSDTMKLLEETEEGLEFMRLSFMSARDWLEETFESEEMMAFYSIWASNHAPLSPEDAGSAFLSLVFVGLLQEKGSSIPIGGMSTLTRSFERFLKEHGCSILLGEGVEEVLVKDGRASGVKTSSGKMFHAKHGIMSNVEPKALFLNMIEAASLDESFLSKVRKFKFSRVTQVMIHAALDKRLNFTSRDTGNAGLVQIGESMDEISRSYNDCMIGKIPEAPFMTINNSTVIDGTRAPPGKHILWNFVRAPALISGRPWEQQDKEEIFRSAMSRLSEYAPNANDIVIGSQVMAPGDIQSLNSNAINGDPVFGQPTVHQMMALRPFPGYSKYRTPLRGLYMCGAYTHPGGGVSGLSGRNAALEAIDDVEKKLI